MTKKTGRQSLTAARSTSPQESLPEVIVVRGGSEEMLPAVTPQSIEPPAPLTHAQKVALIKSADPSATLSSESRVLTVANPVIPGFASLLFWNPFIVDCGSGGTGFARFRGDKPFNDATDRKSFVVGFGWVPKGQKYLIDITVSEGETYYVRAGGNQTVGGDQKHLVVLHEFDGSFFGLFVWASQGWVFHSVELTRLG